MPSLPTTTPTLPARRAALAPHAHAAPSHRWSTTGPWARLAPVAATRATPAGMRHGAPVTEARDRTARRRREDPVGHSSGSRGLAGRPID